MIQEPEQNSTINSICEYATQIVDKRVSSTLIYPEIYDDHEYYNILLIENTVPSYLTFVNSTNSNTFPIVYSTNSSKKELLEFLEINFSVINRIAICFAISTKGETKIFLDNEPLFLDYEVEPNNNVEEPYSSNIAFMLNLIYNFKISNIDFLGCNSLQYQNWVDYYELLQEKTDIIIGASNDRTGNIKYGGDWTMENTNTNIEYIYFKKSIEYYMHLLDENTYSAFTINTGNYTTTTHGDYTILIFTVGDNSNVAELISNYSITVYCTLVGGGGSGSHNGGGGGGGQITSHILNLNKSNTLKITIGYGGEGSNTQGNDGESTTIKYKNTTHTALGGLQGNASYTEYSSYYQLNIQYGGSGGNSRKNSNTGGGLGGNLETNSIAMDGTNGGGGGQGIGKSYADYGDGYIETFDVTGGNGSTQDAFKTGSILHNLFGTSLGASGGGSSGEIVSAQTDNVEDFLGSSGNTYAGNGALCVCDGQSITYATSGADGYGGGGGGTTLGYGSSGSGGSGTAILYFLTPTTPPPEDATISNICFPENTPVLTDQGIIAIQEIDLKINTINNKKIIAITKSISQDNYLVCFKKNCLGYNYPSEDTTMTKEHKIKYDNQMVEADNFLGYIDDVVKVGYNGKILYNVLMEKYEKINVNNLICETLHPQNKIAKIYNSGFSEDYKKRLIEWTNEIAIKDANDKLHEYKNEKIMLQKLEKIINITKQNNLTKYNSWQNALIETKLKNYIKNKETDEKQHDELIKKKEKLNNEKIKKYYEEYNKYYNEYKEIQKTHRYTQKRYKIKLRSKSVTYKK